MQEEDKGGNAWNLLWFGLSAGLLLVAASHFVAILQANSINGLALNEIISTVMQGAGITLIGSGVFTSGGQEKVRRLLTSIGIARNLHGFVVCLASTVLVSISVYLHRTLDDYYYEQGMALYEQGELTEAREALRQSLALNDQSLRVDLALGRVYESLGDLKAAQKHYHQAVEAGLPDGFNRMGHALIHSGDQLSAEALLRLGLQRSYGNALTTEEALNVRHHLHRNLGWALLNEKKYDEALLQFSQALGVYPEGNEKPSATGFTHCLVGHTYDQLGAQEQAVVAWQKCLKRAQPEMILEYQWVISIGRSDIASCLETGVIVAGIDPVVSPSDLAVCTIDVDKMQGLAPRS